MARIYLERRDLGDELRHLMTWLESDEGSGAECAPAMDVFETASALEVIADLPGVRADAVRVVISRGVLLIAGTKQAATCEQRETRFHLAERSFGRFARAVRLAGAYDAGRATARLSEGELHVVLPRIEERRGREIRVQIDTV